MLEDIILSPIPLSDLLNQVKQAVREELNGSNPSVPVVNNGRPLTTKQLCKYLEITEPTVLRWRKKGKIPYMTIGSSIRFNLKDVLKSLEKK
jgi:excisionase family DNA binding protein